MLPTVAGMFVLLGTALWLLVQGQIGVGNRFGQAIALVVASIGALALVECILGWNYGLEVMLFGETHVRRMGAFPGRPAFPSAASAVALGLALLLLDVHARRVWVAEVLAVITMQMALLGIMGHLFGVPELYGSADFTPGKGMAVHASAGFLILGAGVLCARADRGLMALLRSRTPGGVLARRWVFMPALLLLGMGLVYFTFQRALGLSRAVESWAGFVISLTMITAAIWITAQALHEAGLERDAAHHNLEEKVRERTSELSRAYTALNEAKEQLAQINRELESKVQERTMHLRETIRSLETVCYNIAHDLRAPNRAIAGFAQVLLSEHPKSFEPATLDCLERIAKAAHRSDELTLDLLAYGRLGLTSLPCSRQSLRAHLEAAAEKLKAEIEASGGSLEISEPLPEVWANPVALEQVLTNLLTNAFKFVEPGVSPRVTVSAEHSGAACRVLIRDNGIGIPPEHQDRVFGVFERLHRPETFPGTGIGLAIVHKSVERMGGRVGVTSSPGTGSCFWFELPVPQENGSPASPVVLDPQFSSVHNCS